MITVNEACLSLIKHFEGLVLKAYHGAADKPGIYTIGYGCIQYPPDYLQGRRVALTDPDITEARALHFLRYEVMQKADRIDLLLRDDLTPNQAGALISFAYNLGEGALKGSHLRLKVNTDPSDPSIRDEFMKWDMSNGAHIKGLARRRMAEADLYFS